MAPLRGWGSGKPREGVGIAIKVQCRGCVPGDGRWPGRGQVLCPLLWHQMGVAKVTDADIRDPGGSPVAIAPVSPPQWVKESGSGVPLIALWDRWPQVTRCLVHELMHIRVVCGHSPHLNFGNDLKILKALLH